MPTNTLTIGSGKSCDIIINDNHVSPVHAELSSLENGSLLLIDKNSLNGVFVNGNKVNTHILQPGDQVMLANAIRFPWQQYLEKLAEMDTEEPETETTPPSVPPQQPVQQGTEQQPSTPPTASAPSAPITSTQPQAPPVAGTPNTKAQQQVPLPAPRAHQAVPSASQHATPTPPTTTTQRSRLDITKEERDAVRKGYSIPVIALLVAGFGVFLTELINLAMSPNGFNLIKGGVLLGAIAIPSVIAYKVTRKYIKKLKSWLSLGFIFGGFACIWNLLRVILGTEGYSSSGLLLLSGFSFLVCIGFFLAVLFVHLKHKELARKNPLIISDFDAYTVLEMGLGIALLLGIYGIYALFYFFT